MPTYFGPSYTENQQKKGKCMETIYQLSPTEQVAGINEQYF